MNEGTDVDIIDHTIWNRNYVFNMATGTTNSAGESFKGFENAIMGNAVIPLPVMQPTIR